MKIKRTIQSLSLDGGELCLNFINTIHDRTDSDPFDYLKDFENWVEWIEKVKVVPSEKMATLRKPNPGSVEKLMENIHNTREVLYQLFRSIARGEQLKYNTLKTFNTHLSEALSNVRIVQQKNNLVEDWAWEENVLLLPLHAIVKSAFDLIVDGEFDRIKECDMCGWLFLDKSKNNSRRWCNMQACGSIHKTRKYYQRKKRKESKN